MNMADQTPIAPAPLVVAPDQAPDTAAIHPPTQSFGAGSADESAGSADGDKTGVGMPDIGGTGDRGGPDRLAARE